MGGSSPLARGLRGTRSSPVSPGPDHPRSRGVYCGQGVTYETCLGSSPLARGLPTSASPFCDWGRIIPARAGFTFNIPVTYVTTEDHPRSRGVY